MSSLRTELQAIYDRHGALTPRLVVDEARAEAHPLHASLEWDDSIGGERYRELQAQALIRTVKITYRPASKGRPAGDIRAWQSVRGESGYTYEPAESVARDPLMREIILRDMRREWQTFKARYDHFSEFAAMVRQDIAS